MIFRTRRLDFGITIEKTRMTGVYYAWHVDCSNPGCRRSLFVEKLEPEDSSAPRARSLGP
jgi:hypothetical protein